MNIDIILAGFDASQIEQTKSVAWLLIGLLAFSAAVGVYNFLQMRKMQKKNRPKPNQLDGTIADEGISFYDLAGSPHVHTNITDIWDKDAQAIKKKSGGFLGMGKTSQVTGYRYYAKFAAFIGNRIEKFIGINFDNRGWILHDPLKHPPNLLPIEKPSLYGEDEGGVSGNIDIHFGYPDQEPNAEYQKYFPLVSGYPYQSYLVFRGLNVGQTLSTSPHGFYLGNSGYMKEMLLWVKRTRVRNDGRGQWYEVRGDGAVVCEIGEMVDLRPYWNQPYISNNIYETDIYRTWTYEYKYNSAPTTSGVSHRDVPDASLPSYMDNMGTVVASGNLDKYAFSRATAHYVFKHAGLIKVTGTLLTSSESENIRIRALKIYDYKERKEQFDGVRETIFEFYAVIGFDESGNLPQIFIEVEAKGTYGGDLHQLFLQRVKFQYLPIERGYMDMDYLDINPIHKIREILTDDTAMAKPESDVNDVNFMKAADRIWDEGLGISWAIDEKSCIDAIEELCYHIEAGVRVNRQTGLYEMVLFRDNWFTEEEIHDIAENKIKNLSLEIMNSDDIVNQLNVTYYDRERIKNSAFSVYENGSILTIGHANVESVDFPYFMNMRSAEIVANWKLKQFSTPAWSGSFTTGWREARKWNRYDLIRLPWSKKWNGTILVRIMKINLGNGTDNTVTIDFEEIVPYSGEMNTSIVADESMNLGALLPQPAPHEIFEAPYFLTVLKSGQVNADLELSNNPEIGYVAAIAAKPQSNSLSALLYTDGSTGEFEEASRLDYCDILQLDQPIGEATHSFTVTGFLTQPANSNNLIFLNDELMGFVSFDAETKVLSVKRGVLDTVPKKHSSGSLFVFDLPDVAFDSTQYAQSEVIEAQVLTTTPSGIQELAGNSKNIEIQARAIRPYPPANVKINTQYFPVELLTNSIQLSWVDRNRIQQTEGEYLSWFDSSVSMEPDTTYHLSVVAHYSDNTTTTLVDQNIGAVNEYLLDVSAQPMGTLFYRIKLATIRNNYECYQPFEFNLMTELLAPINLHAEVFVDG